MARKHGKGRELRRIEATQRAQLRKTRTPEEQLQRLRDRGIHSGREVDRLNGKPRRRSHVRVIMPPGGFKLETKVIRHDEEAGTTTFAWSLKPATAAT